MDGTSVVPIVTRYLRWPNGIALDAGARQLYWVDAYFNRLETSTVNGLYRSTFVSNSRSTVHHSFGVVVNGGYLYWTDVFRRALYRKKIVPGVNDTLIETRVVRATSQPYGFSVVDVRAPRHGGRMCNIIV
jgi:hypothetical protein